MTDEQPRARGNVPVAKHMFHLADTGITPRARFVSHNGLTVTQPGIVVILTGISSGPVTVTVDPRPSPPSAVDLDRWDVVVEIPVQAPTGRMVVTGVAADAPELPVLTPGGPGPYRFRVHARGRDLAVDHGVTEPVEEYLVTTWPAAPTAEATLKRADLYGRTWRDPDAIAPAPPTPSPDDARRARLEDSLRRAERRARN